MLIISPETSRASLSRSVFLQQINIISKLQIINLVAMYRDSSSILLYWVHHSFKMRDESCLRYRICLSRTDCGFEPGLPSPSTRTADFALSLIFCRISTSLVPTPYDLKVAQVTSCLIKPNAFCKSMKPLMMCLTFRFAFSAISFRIRIWCTLLLSLLNPACSSDKCISICAFNLSNNTVISILPTWLWSAIIVLQLLHWDMWWWPILSIPLVCSLPSFLPSIFDSRYATLL